MFPLDTSRSRDSVQQQSRTEVPSHSAENNTHSSIKIRNETSEIRINSEHNILNVDEEVEQSPELKAKGAKGTACLIALELLVSSSRNINNKTYQQHDTKGTTTHETRPLILLWQQEQLRTDNGIQLEEFVGLSRSGQYYSVGMILVLCGVFPALFVYLVFGMVDFGAHEDPNTIWNCMWACTFVNVPLTVHSLVMLSLNAGSPAQRQEEAMWLQENPEQVNRFARFIVDAVVVDVNNRARTTATRSSRVSNAATGSPTTGTAMQAKEPSVHTHEEGTTAYANNKDRNSRRTRRTTRSTAIRSEGRNSVLYSPVSVKKDGGALQFWVDFLAYYRNVFPVRLFLLGCMQLAVTFVLLVVLVAYTLGVKHAYIIVPMYTASCALCFCIPFYLAHHPRLLKECEITAQSLKCRWQFYAQFNSFLFVGMYVIMPLGTGTDIGLVKLMLCVLYQLYGDFMCIYVCDRLAGSGVSEVFAVTMCVAISYIYNFISMVIFGSSSDSIFLIIVFCLMQGGATVSQMLHAEGIATDWVLLLYRFVERSTFGRGAQAQVKRVARRTKEHSSRASSLSTQTGVRTRVVAALAADAADAVAMVSGALPAGTSKMKGSSVLPQSVAEKKQGSAKTDDDAKSAEVLLDRGHGGPPNREQLSLLDREDEAKNKHPSSVAKNKHPSSVSQIDEHPGAEAWDSAAYTSVEEADSGGAVLPLPGSTRVCVTIPTKNSSTRRSPQQEGPCGSFDVASNADLRLPPASSAVPLSIADGDAAVDAEEDSHDANAYRGPIYTEAAGGEHDNRAVKKTVLCGTPPTAEEPPIPPRGPQGDGELPPKNESHGAQVLFGSEEDPGAQVLNIHSPTLGVADLVRRQDEATATPSGRGSHNDVEDNIPALSTRRLLERLEPEEINLGEVLMSTHMSDARANVVLLFARDIAEFCVPLAYVLSFSLLRDSPNAHNVAGLGGDLYHMKKPEGGLSAVAMQSAVMFFSEVLFLVGGNKFVYWWREGRPAYDYIALMCLFLREGVHTLLATITNIYVSLSCIWIAQCHIDLANLRQTFLIEQRVLPTEGPI